MHRGFVTSTTRQCVPLDGFWDLVFDPSDMGVNQAWFARFPPDARRMWVPGVWNTLRGCLNYEGVAWLRRRFSLGPCSAAVLHFGAVTHQANVWLDGEPLGEHYGGWLPFSFLLPEIKPGEHELVVRVDNTHDMATTIPSASLDWCRYGGISRPVWVEELAGPGYINSLRLHASLDATATDGHSIVTGLLHVHAELLNLSEHLLNGNYALLADDQPLKSGPLQIDAGDTETLELTCRIDDVRLWSPAQPHLYSVRLTYAGDDLVERTGFREIRLDGHQVLLNGVPLRMRGVNRHEDHPDWGFALPDHLMLRDLELVRDLGFNAIRGAQNPNDPRFLDMCDEQGLLFMEEIPLWGFKPEQLGQDIIASRASAMLWAMIERDVAHPCIWAWSVLNECATDSSEGQAVVAQLVSTAREADPSRPVTYASHKGSSDICLDLVDLVSVNAYYGWYVHNLTWPEFLDRMRAKVGDKPLIVTEFGAAGLYGCHSLEEDVMWSEEYQRKVLTGCVEILRSREDLAGFYVWQFCDTRSDRGLRALTRARSYNNKGLLDEYRRPKLAYYALRELLARSGNGDAR